MNTDEAQEPISPSRSQRECINYLDPSKTVLLHDTIGTQVTLKPDESVLKEGKGQSLYGQVEITSNQSKIQNPLIENETKNK